MGVVIDLTGQKFGRLLVIEKAGTNKSRHMTWKCKCDCGKEKIVSSNSLKRGATVSCGCYATEITIKNNLKKGIHNLATSRQYNIWAQMKQRCTNENNKNYESYGAKGITYCEKWETFEGFWEDMGSGYSDHLTLDRLDNSKGYSKGNCRWATTSQQSNNRTTNRLVTVNGLTDTVANMARKHGISPDWHYGGLINTNVRKMFSPLQNGLVEIDAKEKLRRKHHVKPCDFNRTPYTRSRITIFTCRKGRNEIHHCM